MDRAKAAVSDFLHKDGKTDTTVHEKVNPAVQHENITPTRHENVTKAVDREVHQDHYHTTVQPVHDREVLPEKHSHNLAGTEHREIHHGNSDRVKEAHVAEGSQFKNTREVNSTQHTRADQGTVGGEHVHHHVHENIQPVVQKETIQPNVVHTTIPVHEVHHNEAKHHSSSALPAMSINEFKQQGGSLTGRDTRTDAFVGAPKGHIHENIGGQAAQGTTHLTERDGHSGTTGTSTGTAGPHGSNLANKADPRVDSDRDGSRNAGLATGAGATGTTSGLNSSSRGPGGVEFGNTHSTTGTHGASTTGTHGTSTTGTHGTSTTGTHGTSTTGTHGTSTAGTHKKPSLMDKLNPKVDADGDGKAGFMK